MSQIERCRHSFGRQLKRLLVCLTAAVVSIVVLPTAATAALSDPCVGLECETPSSPFYVPEAQGTLPFVESDRELEEQPRSGFYEMPALVYQGHARPQAVVYLAKAGELDQMPSSVRNLRVVQDLSRGSSADLNNTTFVVVDKGIAYMLDDEGSADAEGDAPLADPYGPCGLVIANRYFCLYENTNYGGRAWPWYGPNYVGNGWYNLGTNFGSSHANARGGDTLLADHGLGTGTRYCAQQNSLDATFANNPIGNGNASSIALLPSSIDRC